MYLGASICGLGGASILEEIVEGPAAERIAGYTVMAKLQYVATAR